MVLILVLRKNPEDLSFAEKRFIEDAYPEGVEYRRVDPTNYSEHDEFCRTLNPAMVILPMERPIPSLAMEHGYRHIAFTPDGPMELVSLHTQFKPFSP